MRVMYFGRRIGHVEENSLDKNNLPAPLTFKFDTSQDLLNTNFSASVLVITTSSSDSHLSVFDNPYKRNTESVQANQGSTQHQHSDGISRRSDGGSNYAENHNRLPPVGFQHL